MVEQPYGRSMRLINRWRIGLVAALRKFTSQEKTSTGTEVFALFFALVGLGWFINALNQNAGPAICRFVKWASLPEAAVATLELVLPLLVVAIALWFLAKVRRDSLTPPSPAEPPAGHRGLILMLSDFKDQGSELASTAAALCGLASQPEFRREVFRSNWGPLAVAVEHHAVASKLQRCWLICTPTARNDFDDAKRLIGLFARSEVHVERVDIGDPNDLVQVMKCVKEIYRGAAAIYSLPPEEIIADFTGGTAAMSGGMILGALQSPRHLEYLCRGKPLLLNGQPRKSDEILRAKILAGVVIDSLLVLDAVQEDLEARGGSDGTKRAPAAKP
jgi:hypothetical protein